MKTYGFILAADMEFIGFQDYLLKNGGRFLSSDPFTVVRLQQENQTLIAVHAGVGKVNAAMAAMELILTYKADAILNGGLSGAISGLRRKDVVAGTHYVECDFDLRSFDRRLGEKDDGSYIYKADRVLLEAASMVHGMKQGRLGTGDFFLTDADKKEFYLQEFDLNAFDMESGAIAAVCAKYKVPFLSLRKISDDAADTALESYSDMDNLADSDFTDIFLAVLENIEKVGPVYGTF